MFAALGCAAFFCGCSSPTSITTTSGPTSAPLAPGGASSVDVVQYAGMLSVTQVLSLATDGSGSGTPPVLRASTTTFFAYDVVATDSAGELYVPGFLPDGTEYVKVFAAGATGQASAIRGFAPPAASGNMPVTAMTIDAAGNEFIAGSGTVMVFPPSANPQDEQPTSTITLPSAEVPVAIAVDSSDNVYLACNSSGTGPSSGSIFVYALQSNGGSLIRTITTKSVLAGIAAGPAGNVFAVENTSDTNAPGITNTVTVAEFAAGVSGAATPIKTISGSATGMTFGGGVTLDSVGNLYLVNTSMTGTTQSPVTTPSVLIFGPTASGNEPPAVTLTSTAWTAPGSQLTVH